MSLLQFELHWSAGGVRHAFVIHPDGSPRLSASAITAAETATERATGSGSSPGPTRRGKGWTEADDAWLREGFARAETPTALAGELGRSSGAVRARLVRMGLLDAADAGLRYPVAPAPAPPEDG